MVLDVKKEVDLDYVRNHISLSPKPKKLEKNWKKIIRKAAGYTGKFFITSRGYVVPCEFLDVFPSLAIRAKLNVYANIYNLSNEMEEIKLSIQDFDLDLVICRSEGMIVSRGLYQLGKKLGFSVQPQL